MTIQNEKEPNQDQSVALEGPVRRKSGGVLVVTFWPEGVRALGEFLENCEKNKACYQQKVGGEPREFR